MRSSCRAITSAKRGEPGRNELVQLNVHDPAFLQDPYPTYDRLRTDSPDFL